MPTHTWL